MQHYFLISWSSWTYSRYENNVIQKQFNSFENVATQGSNAGLPCCRQILYQLSHQGRPRILEWVAISFSRGSSRPRDRIQVSCIVGRHYRLSHQERWKSKLKVKVTQLCLTLCVWLCSPWNSTGQNTGEGHLSLLQRIFPTQESNPGLPHCSRILYQLSHQGQTTSEWLRWS